MGMMVLESDNCPHPNPIGYAWVQLKQKCRRAACGLQVIGKRRLAGAGSAVHQLISATFKCEGWTISVLLCILFVSSNVSI